MINLSLTRPNTLVHAVTERLREAIVTAELKLGETLSEEKLATAFGVSRTPVREALNLLQLQGLIEIAPQRGSFVFRPTVEDIAHLCDFRISMELTVIPLCEVHDHESTNAALLECLEKMEKAFAEDDGFAYATFDDALHQLFFSHCGNPYFQDAYGLIAGKISALRNNLTIDYQADRAVSMEEHRQIVKMFSESEFEDIEKVLKAHIGRTRENFLQAMENGVF
ncbi:GntR family transcriptional regulator [Aliiruegeria lutimaris]|uniref:Transcriptional regulator, GntR family n=1 Tax=Aliiruegeria lutimaris TaxID=571298 RepID=A0A1G8R3H2_9RHOB|nr:GntR family transcriptional regulator [Aliiruegeria lutimaris]SDJ11534.1 transcriptional regulator, GntR family [Aliiruegeria lutimaris]